MDPTLIHPTLQKDLIHIVTERLGVMNLPESVQQETISEFSRNIVNRIIVEIAKTLPTGKHDRLKKIIEVGDWGKLKKFLSKFIPDVEVFVRHVAKKEVEETMTEFEEEVKRLTDEKL